ncbi:MAG: peptidylprolyl isomerase, partial [Comamonas sp.]
MKSKLPSLALAAAIATMSAGALAQNAAIVNGKPVPSARVDALVKQIERSGRPITPELRDQI